MKHIARCGCSSRTSVECRKKEQMKRNERAGLNPIEILEDDGTDMQVSAASDTEAKDQASANGVESADAVTEASTLPSDSSSPSISSTISSMDGDVSSLARTSASGSSSVASEATAPSVAKTDKKRKARPVETRRKQPRRTQKATSISYADDDDESFLSPSGSSDGESDEAYDPAITGHGSDAGENDVDFPPLPPLPNGGVDANANTSHQVVSSGLPDPVAHSAVSSKRRSPANGGKKKKRKTNRAKAATAAKKTSKAKPKRDLPQGVYETSSGKFRSKIRLGGKNRQIGTFDTPEQASAAYMSLKKNRADAKLSTLGAVEVEATFDASQKKAVEAVGGIVPDKRDLPLGVRKTTSGKFESKIRWGRKQHHIGTFDTPEQASAAYMSVKNDLDDVNLSAVGADEVNALFDAAKKKAVEAVGGSIPKKKDFPKGVYKTLSGKFQSRIKWGGKGRHIGMFDTPEQASAAYLSVKEDLEGVNLSAAGAEEVNAMFDAAIKKVVETVGGFIPERRRLPTGVHETSSGKFQSRISCGGKQRTIGNFATLEQAAAAYNSVKMDLADANQSAAPSPVTCRRWVVSVWCILRRLKAKC